MENQNKLREIFNKHDLVKIYFGKETNVDEYDPEIKQLLIHLDNIHSLEEMEKTLIRIFEDMFYRGIVKDKQKYKELTKELYNLLFKK